MNKEPGYITQEKLLAPVAEELAKIRARRENSCREADLKIRRFRRALVRIAKEHHVGCVCGSLDPAEWNREDDKGRLKGHVFDCPSMIAWRALKRG
jgi:gamma-glutamyl:cysteine ligase YbdK (ATP-grasp superfamily)